MPRIPRPIAGTEGVGAVLQAAPGTVSGLLYHKVDYAKLRVVRRGLYVSPRLFAKQLGELRRAGFRSITADEAFHPEPTRRVFITFDDGFRSVCKRAMPILERSGFSAMNFLVADLIGRSNLWDIPDRERSEPLMDANEVRTWLGGGHSIGAHTCTHTHLCQLSDGEAREEITRSKKALEDRFGIAVTDFAYPYGEVDARIRRLVEEAEFQRGWTTDPASIAQDSDPFLLPRFPVVVSLRRPSNLLRSLPWIFR